jgi:hypothetical protein
LGRDDWAAPIAGIDKTKQMMNDSAFFISSPGCSAPFALAHCS